MIKFKNLGVNAILNVIKTVLSVLFPLITYPYAVSILGTEGIGKVSFGSSIIHYFSLIALMGISSYAVREGAKYRKNKRDFVKFTKEIFTINMCFTILAYSLLAICILISEKLRNYSILLWLQSVSIILTTFGIEWVNTVYEDYFLITIRSIATHIITLVLLFVLVKKPEDYYIYALLSVLSNGIICVTNLIHCRKYTRIGFTAHPNFKKHIKPLIILFFNTVAVSIYVNFDNTMLGWIKGDHYVGLYTISVKVYTVVKTMMAAIYVVSLSRLSYYSANKQFDNYKKVYTDLWGFLSIILIPASAGLAAVSKEIMLFMGGKVMLEAQFSLQLLSISLLFAIFGGLVTACLNISIHRERDNLIATLIGAGLNCGLNLIFIPLLSHNGAAITTIISEAFVFIFCFARIPSKNTYLDFKKIKPSLIHALLGGIFILAFSSVIHHWINNPIISFIVIVLGSILVYASMLFVLKDEYFCSVATKIKNNLQRNR